MGHLPSGYGFNFIMIVPLLPSCFDFFFFFKLPPEKQLNEVEIGNFSKKKKIEKNDTENDSWSQANNEEDAINVY